METGRKMVNQAIILAAGRGSRLGAVLHNGKPKCLLEINGKPLISYQIQILRSLGIKRIGVVVGHGAGHVYEALDKDISFVVNPRYADTNSLFSLWLAGAWVEGPFMLMNSDLLVHPKIYERVINNKNTCLAYDSSSGDEDEHMKIRLEGNLVRAISKSLPLEHSAGENVGIIKFEETEACDVMGEADRLVRSGKTDHWSPAAIDGIVNRRHFEAVDIADLPWTEIDFPEDWENACKNIWPKVEKHLQYGHAHRPHPVPHTRPTRLTPHHPAQAPINPVAPSQHRRIASGLGMAASRSIYRIPAWPMT